MWRYVDDRFFDIIGYDKSDLMVWGYKSYDEEMATWYVSIMDAMDFCTALGVDPSIADI